MVKYIVYTTIYNNFFCLRILSLVTKRVTLLKSKVEYQKFHIKKICGGAISS